MAAARWQLNPGRSAAHPIERKVTVELMAFSSRLQMFRYHLMTLLVILLTSCNKQDPTMIAVPTVTLAPVPMSVATSTTKPLIVEITNGYMFPLWEDLFETGKKELFNGDLTIESKQVTRYRKSKEASNEFFKKFGMECTHVGLKLGEFHLDFSLSSPTKESQCYRVGIGGSVLYEGNMSHYRITVSSIEAFNWGIAGKSTVLLQIEVL